MDRQMNDREIKERIEGGREGVRSEKRVDN